MLFRQPTKGQAKIASPRGAPASQTAARRVLSIGSVLLLLTSLFGPLTARAESLQAGRPGFAYGARLEASGDHLETAVGIAARLGLQWLAMTLDWEEIWADSDSTPDFSSLQQAMDLAQANSIPVMVSVTNAPNWALTPEGPDPNLTTQLILSIVQRYSPIQAVELFPGANTKQGWGAQPDPGSYMALFRDVQAGMGEPGLNLKWVAGGLTPLPAGHEPADLDDLAYLDGLYDQGGAEYLSIVSLRFADITGSPLASPFGSEARVLRRYEAARQIMLNHNHKNGRLWITSFTWPSGKISQDDAVYGDPETQAYWLHQAYHLLSSQLYIGVAFFNGLNTPQGKNPAGIEGKSLIAASGGLHPGLWNLSQLISFTENRGPLNLQGLISIKKISFDKNRFKPFL